MTQTVTLPNGDEIDFPDNMSQDELSAAVSRHMAATNSGATLPAGNEPSIAARSAGFPASSDWRSTPTAKNIATGAQVGALSGIHALAAIPDLAAATVQSGQNISYSPLDLTASETGQQPTEAEVKATTPAPSNRAPWLPSQTIINGIGDAVGRPLELGNDAPQWAKTAESVLPWLIPTGNQISRVGEAAGRFNKIMTGARSELGNAADWFTSDDMQKWARDNGYSPAVQTLLGIVGGSARHIASAGGGAAMPIIAGRSGDEGGVNYDKNRAVGVTPPLSSVADSDKTLPRLAAGLSAFPGTLTGTASAEKAQTNAIAAAADKGLQKLAPGSTPVQEANPETLKNFSTDLGNQGRELVEQNESALKAQSDALEQTHIGLDQRIDATPILDKINGIIDGSYGSAVKKAAREALNRLTGKDGSVDPATNTISFDALKTEKSTFGGIVDDMFQSSSGEKGGKDTVAGKLTPIEDAMGAGLQSAADEAGVGPQWQKLQGYWTQHSRIKRGLADTAGVLGDVNRQGQKWDKYADADTVRSNLQGAVSGGDMPKIDDIEQGLGPDLARQAVAETIAAKGQPQGAKSNENFRPDVWGQQASRDVNPNVRGWIGEQAGPEAQADIEKSIAAGRTTGKPSERGGFWKGLGGTLTAGGTLAGLGHLGGAAGLLAAPIYPFVASALHDPSFIRAVAGRRLTADNIAGLLTQYAQHAGLGARPDFVDPVAAVQSGIGSVANAASQAAAYTPSVVSTLTKYLSGGQK